MDAVVQEQTRRGTGNMKEMFKPQPAWKVSKIVFLQGCIDVIPGNMIQGLNEVLMMYDPVTLVRKCKYVLVYNFLPFLYHVKILNVFDIFKMFYFKL
jgi:hypothetical protein